LRSWLNLSDPLLIPIEERPLVELSSRRFIPPQIRQQGLTPRLSLIEEYTDNVFRSAGPRAEDFITVASPGLHFRAEDRRLRVEADYSFEAVSYAKHPELDTLMGDQTGLLSGSLALTQRTSVQLLELFQSFDNPSEEFDPNAPPSSIVVGRTTTRQNFFGLTGEHQLSPTATLRLRLAHFLQDIDRQNVPTRGMFEGAVDLETRFTRRDQLGLEYRTRFFHFEDGDNTVRHAALLSYEHELAETLILRIQFGPEFGSRTVDFVSEASVKTSLMKMAILQIGFRREFFVPQGSDLVVAHSGFASALLRLGRGFRADAGVFARFDDARDGEDDLQARQFLAVRGGLTYAFTPGLVARLGYIFSQVKQRESAGEVRTNRIIINLTTSF
jgi:hypothetical protein